MEEEESSSSSVYRRLNTVHRHLCASSNNQQPLTAQPLSCSLVPALESFDELDELGSMPVIIGGMVLDIHAKPSTKSHPGTTTPGKVYYVAGGVARNVAECMSKLGTKPFMISVIGLDMPGNALMEYWKAARLTTQGIEMRQDIHTPVVCNLFDATGEVTGVASVEALEIFLTKERIQKFSCNIRSAPIVMIDANLNVLALKASCMIAAGSNISVWFEPVSVAKSKRIASIARYVTFTSPNENELIAMANALACEDRFSPIQISANGENKKSVESLFQRLKPAILVLLENGIKIVVVTLGADGVFVCFKNESYLVKNHLKNTKPLLFGRRLHKMVASSCPSSKFEWLRGSESRLHVVHFPSLPASVVRLTGAGDCLVGGTLASICTGLDVLQSIAVGIAAAKAAVEVEINVPATFLLTTIAENARVIYSLAKVVCDQPLL
ncbi:hypothetical protein ACHQM5_017056 [Ranunculus cassubicifolius]